MHPREVAEVGEVLHLPRGVAVPGERPGVHHLPGAGFELGHLGQRVRRLALGQAHPDEAVALLALIHRRARLGGNGGGGRLRNAHARARRVVVPRVVRTHEAIVGDPAERERGAAVDAQVAHRVRAAVAGAPHDHGFAEQRRAERLVRHLVRVGHGVPASGLFLGKRGAGGGHRGGHATTRRPRPQDAVTAVPEALVRHTPQVPPPSRSARGTCSSCTHCRGWNLHR